ncbi:unnamed protein product [Fraxinus pennsylvanica]|uniref:Uncharacterized protein n=1 Tax=Fraxinus pennsylvanica TaxID=56036 RepID=A0AAD2E9U1_9LAMI|nr:unnamed protein product [Fraxinus pennsylvanica]
MVSQRDHKGFAFESFVCREIFSGFNEPYFSIQNDHQSLPNDTDQRQISFFEQFKKLRSVSVIQFLGQNPNSLFGNFLKAKYLHLIHPKIEVSFARNSNKRKMVNSGEFPETKFFKAFANMGRRVWLLHCLAFSLDQEVSIFQFRKPTCKYI